MKHFIFILLLFIIIKIDAQNVGIGTNIPTEKLQVNGAVKLGNTVTNNPGSIRFGTDNKISGNEGSGWKALISSGTAYSFGNFTSNIRNTTVATPWTISVPEDGEYIIILESNMVNSQNYSGTVYDTQGYIYLTRSTDNLTFLSHHAAKNEFESYGTGYVYSMVAAEFPKITIINLAKDALLSISARFDCFGSPAPTSNWTINYVNIILVKLN